ncbi:hypothetical protein BGP_1900 [Beggiatoa sp. PS]|nr:hypothetical protein BGP_1900 [Beggiatoa sp. PS]
MNHDGTVAYYGPIQQATPYFEQITSTSSVGCNPAEYLLEMLDNSFYSEKITHFFEQRPLNTQFQLITPIQS